MNSPIYSPLQTREIFHLEFLRWFTRKLKAEHYCLKGGVNLRLFLKSIRYSEDMDIDIAGVRVERVKKTVMEILSARGFSDSLKSFGVEKVVAPDLTKAKQTETTQRFKIHLLTSGGEDLFTKIEFSRRGLKGSTVVESVAAPILRFYKMAPLLVSHYDTASAVRQKILALAQRSVLQARDIFDLFVLISQYTGSTHSTVPGLKPRACSPRAEHRSTIGTRCEAGLTLSPAKGGGEVSKPHLPVGKAVLKTACDNIFLVEFLQFRDTVVAYLAVEDQRTYSSSAVWDDIKLKTVHFLEEFKNENT